MLLYINNCLCVSANPKAALLQIDKYFPMKPSSIGPPKVCLGGKVSQVVLPNRVKAYAFSSSQYIHEAINGVEEYLQRKGMIISQKKTLVPLPLNYSPELDISPELMPDKASYYQF